MGWAQYGASGGLGREIHQYHATYQDFHGIFMGFSVIQGVSFEPLLGGSSQDLDTWLLTLASRFAKDRVGPLPNGRFMVYGGC